MPIIIYVLVLVLANVRYSLLSLLSYTKHKMLIISVVKIAKNTPISASKNAAKIGISLLDILSAKLNMLIEVLLN